MHLVAGYCRRRPVLCVPAKGGFGEGLFRSAHIQFCDLAVIHAVTPLFPFLSRPFTLIHRKQTYSLHLAEGIWKISCRFAQKHRRRFVKRNRRSSALQRQLGFRSLCGFSPRKWDFGFELQRFSYELYQMRVCLSTYLLSRKVLLPTFLLCSVNKLPEQIADINGNPTNESTRLGNAFFWNFFYNYNK